MKSTVAALTLLALVTLAGCQSPFPNTPPTAYGAGVRAALASQVIAPQAHPEQGADGAAAAAGYINYQRSYATPVAQLARQLDQVAHVAREDSDFHGRSFISCRTTDCRFVPPARCISTAPI